VSNTQTTTWTTLTSWPNYVRTATGHTYQVKVGTMVWGTAYWQLFPPMSDQKLLSTTKVQILETIYTNYISVVPDSVVVAPIDKITEGEVNARVNAYAAGSVDDLVYINSGRATEMSVATYNSYSSAVQVNAVNRANSNFREGPYWGLYLYLTGHWRAVEVPVGWYSLSASTGGTTTLTGYYDDTPPPPTPNPETEISLTDFSYVESVYNQLKAKYPNTVISVIQDKLITALRSDGNKAATKVVQIYDSYIKAGMSKTKVFELLVNDLGLDINN